MRHHLRGGRRGLAPEAAQVQGAWVALLAGPGRQLRRTWCPKKLKSTQRAADRPSVHPSLLHQGWGGVSSKGTKGGISKQGCASQEQAAGVAVG